MFRILLTLPVVASGTTGDNIFDFLLVALFHELFGEIWTQIGQSVSGRELFVYAKRAAVIAAAESTGNGRNIDLKYVVLSFGALEPGQDIGAVGEVFRTEAAVELVVPHGGDFWIGAVQRHAPFEREGFDDVFNISRLAAHARHRKSKRFYYFTAEGGRRK